MFEWLARNEDFAVRLATLDDATAMQNVYAPFCVDSPATFEEKPPSVEIFRSHMEAGWGQHPWLALVHADNVVGYAYSSQHMERAAYRWSCNASIYMDPSFVGRGNGKMLYGVLFDLLTKQNFVSCYAGITLPNTASVALHESFGFKQFCVKQNVAWKLGQWRHVGLWEKELNPPIAEGRPADPLPLALVL